MRYLLLIICCSLSFSASAQWYRLDLKLKKHERFPLLAQVHDHSIKRLPKVAFNTAKISPLQIDRTAFSNAAAEEILVAKAQHNMRFRIYDEASYNFTELAHLYIQHNKLTEAKWYLLQSNAISHEQNDDRQTIANLMDLAIVKSEIGDYALAQQDLDEAHNIARSKGYRADLIEIEKRMAYLKQCEPAIKPTAGYAETQSNNNQPIKSIVN